MAHAMRLHFSNDSPRNAVFSTSDGQALYKIETPKKWGHRTSTVSKIIPNTAHDDMQDKFEEIAQIEWHSVHKTILKTGGNELEYQTSVLTTGKAMSRHRVFTAPDGKVYRWYMGKSGMHPPVLEEVESKMTIAKYHERHFGILAKRRQAYLDIFDGGHHFMDQIIFTFMYMEKLRRDRIHSITTYGGGGGP